MKSIVFPILVIFFAAFWSIGAPVAVLADGETDTGAGGATFDFHIDNPVTGFDDVPSLITALLEIVMLIATPIVAVMIIYAGYLFVTARGNATQLTTARKTLLYVVIGAAIILGANVIAQAIQGTVDSLT